MSLFDKYLPRHQFAERHQILVDATPGQALDAAEAYEMSGDRVIGGLLAARALPGRLLGRLGFKGTAQPSAFGMRSFVPLERDGDREIVSGLIGRFWRPDGGLARVTDAAGFLAFAEPGVAKLVVSFSAEPAGARTRLVTETWIWCPDDHSRAMLTPYWLVIRLPSGLIRRRMLAAMKRSLEDRAAA